MAVADRGQRRGQDDSAHAFGPRRAQHAQRAVAGRQAIRFYDQVADAAGTAAAGREPGRNLLVAVIEAYLDVCLTNHAVKALIFEARAQRGATTAMADRVASLLALTEPSLRVLGLTPTPLSTRLIMALTSEAALIELEAGREVPAARATIRALLDAAGQAGT